jgi:hypothetical protein
MIGFQLKCFFRHFYKIVTSSFVARNQCFRQRYLSRRLRVASGDCLVNCSFMAKKMRRLGIQFNFFAGKSHFAAKLPAVCPVL